MDAEAMTKAPADADTGAPPPRGGWLRRYAPLLVLVALMAGVFASGLHEHLTLNALARNRAALDGYVRDHLALSVLVFALAYVAAVVLSLPGATILTMAGGLLFGWFWGGTISVLAATAGAVGVFLVARSALGGALTARAGPWIDRLAKGFREDAFNYLLFLRLAPIFPFWLVNLAPAMLGVKASTYITATLIGIVPGTFTYAVVGGGLDSIIEAQRQACAARQECGLDLTVSSLLTPQIIAAFVLLALLALLPPLAKRVLRRKAGAGAPMPEDRGEG